MTTATVPSTNPVDFLLNVETLDKAINGTELTFTDRLGNAKSTLSAAIDSIKSFNNRGAWVATTVYAGKDLVSVSGSWYVCVVPHTSSVAFATDTASKWRLYQGVTLGELNSSIIPHSPAGAGAVATTVQDKLRAISNTPEDRGALAAGGDDSAAFQAAINATIEGGTLTLKAGAVYKANTLKLTKSICIDMNGATVKSTAYAGGMSKKIFYADAVDAVKWVTIKDGKLDGVGTNRGTSAAEMESLIDLDAVQSVKIKRIEIYQHAAGLTAIPAALKDRKIGCLTVRNAERVRIDDVVLHDNWNEQIHVYAGPGSTCYTEITGVKSYRGAINPANTPIEVTGGRVKISGCHLLDTNASVINLQATLSAVIVNNTIIANSGDGYGINFGQDGLTGYTHNVLIEGNHIEATYKGAISVAGSRVKVLNNTLISPGGFGVKCRPSWNGTSVASLLPEFGAQAHQDLFDIEICGNTITDTAYTSSIEGTAIHVEMLDAGYSMKNVKVNDNHISQPGLNASKVLRYGVVLANLRGVDVTGNNILGANISPIFVSGLATFLDITKNKFTPVSYSSQSDSTIVFYAPGQSIAEVRIEQNEFNGYGTPGRFDIDFAGGTPSGFSIINNNGILAGINGLPYNGTVNYTKNDYPTRSSIPTTGTFNLYDEVKAVPAASGAVGWVNVDRRGTLGVLNAGTTTGSITVGTNTLTLSSVSGLSVGQVISVVGAISTGVGAIVLNITGLVVKISSNATSTVSGAAVAYVNPVFKTLGAIGA